MKARIVLLLLGCALFCCAMECYAAPAAPYSREALIRLSTASEKAGLFVPPADATVEVRARLGIKHFRTIYSNAGYDLDKSIAQFIKDKPGLQGNPAVRGTAAMFTNTVVEGFSGIDPNYLNKYLSKEAAVAIIPLAEEREQEELMQAAKKLREAAEKGDIETVKLLIGKEVDINAVDKDGGTALMWAAIEGHTETAKLLIEKGADINTGDNSGCTPLRYAAANNRIETAKLLIEKGADINAVDNTGVTPLKRAVEKGHRAMVDLLRSYGAKE